MERERRMGRWGAPSPPPQLCPSVCLCVTASMSVCDLERQRGCLGTVCVCVSVPGTAAVSPHPPSRARPVPSPTAPPPVSLCVSVPVCSSPCPQGSVPVRGTCAEPWLSFCTGSCICCVYHFSAWEGAGFPAWGPRCQPWSCPRRWVHGEGPSPRGGCHVQQQALGHGILGV